MKGFDGLPTSVTGHDYFPFTHSQAGTKREKRYDEWDALPKPPFDDWMQLMDGVDRRVSRRLLQPQDAQKLRQKIKELYPEADVPKWKA